ncbi:hypothetical protein EVAR_31957_1 [Eumeta japonica]|uniref:Uncharacterized protein n=1 Tax=Eumeta variegata TaxID=151549 RepID=A0A4C1VSH8_EUMVA|nr:hypothetical protein EVAR_31957_1 [Eumeta japonica]
MANAARDADPTHRLVDVRTVSNIPPALQGSGDFVERNYPSLLIVPVVPGAEEWPPVLIPIRPADVIGRPSVQTNGSPPRRQDFHAPRADVKIRENEVSVPHSKEHPCDCGGDHDSTNHESQTKDSFVVLTNENRPPYTNNVMATTTSMGSLQPKTNRTNSTLNATEGNIPKPDKISSDNVTLEVDLNERASFQVDECASDAVKVNGKCVKKE